MGTSTLDHWDISIVVPVYRSENCLEPLVEAIFLALQPRGLRFEIILVNDFSPDGSWRTIERLCRAKPEVIGVDLRKNFGQDNAIMTGMRLARGRLVAIMDDDLQHDPRDLPAMIEQIEAGADICYARFHSKRHKLWKNLGSWFNGKMAELLIDKPPHIYLSPYKVVCGEVAAMVTNYGGPSPYVDGLLLQVTSRLAQITVEHHERHAGESSYSLRKSIQVWSRLAVSFSVFPLRLVMMAGVACTLLSLLGAVYVVIMRIFWPADFANAIGWASQMVVILLIAGVQLGFLGVLGEYTGRMFLTVNRAPQTSIREVKRHIPSS